MESANLKNETSGVPGAGVTGQSRLWRTGVLAAIGVVVAGGVGLALLFLVLPADGREKALRAIINGVMLGGVYALIGLGVVVVYKATKVFNLAFGGMAAFLAYVAWWFITTRGLPIAVALLLVVVISVLLGLLIDRLVIRRVIAQGGLSSFIVTLVIGTSVFYGATVLLFTAETRVMPRLFPEGGIDITSGIHVDYTWLFAFATAMIMFLVFVAYFRFTNSGLSMRAVSEDPVISQSLGINVTLITAIAWAVGGLSAGVGGILLGSMLYVNTELSGFALSRGMPAMLLGGMESLPGTLVGAFIIGIVESLSGTYIDPHLDGFSQLLPYILMVAILIIRPHGLFGLSEIRRI